MIHLDLSHLDMLWVLVCAFLVMTMQVGFCCLESGLVRSKNSINVAMKNFVDFCISVLVFSVIGFGLMFGESTSGLIGWPSLSLANATPSVLAFIFFQAMFCGTATTIVAGAVAERMTFSGYLVVTALIATLIYPITGHWVWGGVGTDSGGFLANMGFRDFAGSTAVHSVAGWIALAALLVIGPRQGRFDAEAPPIRAHSVQLATVGTLLLWFGWFGFNAGSTIQFSDTVSLIVINTALAGAAGGVSSLLLSWAFTGQPRVEGLLNGALAGLVGITAGCDIASPTGAIFVGCIAAAAALGVERLMVRMRFDDAVCAIPVHLGAGILGTLAVPFLALDVRLGIHALLGDVAVQAVGVASCGAYAFVGGYVAVRVAAALVCIRVSPDEEVLGLNIAEHGAATEAQDLLRQMRHHQESGTLDDAQVEPHTEIGEITIHYNAVLARIRRDRAALEQAYDQASDKNARLEQARRAKQEALADLQLKVDELEEFHRLVVGRELRMIELKKEVNRLLLLHGSDARYELPDAEVAE